MEQVQIIKELFADEIVSESEFRGQFSVVVKRDRMLDIARFLHDDPRLSFDYLMDLCGVDQLGRRNPRFEVVYHLYSMEHRHMLRVKAQVPEDDCRISSVVSVWAGANWHEREAYDLFGIVFDGHPDLRRVLLPEDWEGFPLRKDFPVEGRGIEHEGREFSEVLERSKRFSEFDWYKK